jgi:hypothetical protein
MGASSLCLKAYEPPELPLEPAATAKGGGGGGCQAAFPRDTHRTMTVSTPVLLKPEAPALVSMMPAGQHGAGAEVA